jgi:hypothetical protein
MKVNSIYFLEVFLMGKEQTEKGSKVIDTFLQL